MAATDAGSGRLGRSILAILVGFIVVAVLSLGTDEVFHLLKIYPPWGQIMSGPLFGLATAYRIIYGILGSYITARIAPHHPMRHALIGGAIGLVLSTLGAVATWNRNLGPHWYPVVLIVTAMPCAWIGGKLYGSRAFTANQGR